MRTVLLVLCTMVLLAASPAWAAETVDCTYLTVVVPNDWVVVEKPSEDKDGMLSAVFGKKDKSASLSLMLGKTEGKSAKEIAEILGSSVGAVEKPVEFKGQYGFAVKANGFDGFCVISTDKDIFLMSVLLGDLPSCSQIVESITSKNYPEIVPK